ncbi:MAG: hypothetical protein SF029_01600 [bacterium]|nr:hypothetical protein [bacterium]
MIGELSTEQRVRKILGELEWMVRDLNAPHPWEQQEALDAFTRTYRSGIAYAFLRDTVRSDPDDATRALAQCALDLYAQIPDVVKR